MPLTGKSLQHSVRTDTIPNSDFSYPTSIEKIKAGHGDKSISTLDLSCPAIWWCFITLPLTAYPVARCYDNMNFSADGFQYVGVVLRKKSGKLLFLSARLTFTILLQRGHLHSTVPVAIDVL